MTQENWQDKYKDLEVGKFVWYWHKVKLPSGKIEWMPITVHKELSKDGSIRLLAYNWAEDTSAASEDFPNGPKCLTPDDIINYDLEKKETGIEGNNKEILIDSLCDEFGITEGKMRRAIDSVNKKIKRARKS